MKTENAAPIRCDLCSAEVDSVTAAIEAGWSPSYFVGDDETGRPLCDACSATRCKVENESGELVLLRSSDECVKFDKAVELLKRAARQFYEIGSNACVALGESIDKLLGSEEFKAEGKRLE